MVDGPEGITLNELGWVEWDTTGVEPGEYTSTARGVDECGCEYEVTGVITVKTCVDCCCGDMPIGASMDIVVRGVHYNLVQNDGNPCYFEYREGSPPDVPYKYLTATFETLSNPVRCVINFDGAMVRNQEDDWYGTSRYTLVDGDTCCNLKGIVPTPDLGNPPTLIASMNC